jgi:hypothetical protein
MSMNAEMQEKPKKKNTAQDLFARMGVLGELLAFFWKRKQFWRRCVCLYLVLVQKGMGQTTICLPHRE